MEIDKQSIPPPPGLAMSGTSGSVDFADKIDLQTISMGLIFMQHEAVTRVKEVIEAFNAISDAYRNDKTTKKTIRTSRIMRGEFIEKEIDVIYIYSDEGQAIFEHNAQKLEEASGLAFELLIDLYSRLYKMRPEEEQKHETVSHLPPELQQPGGPDTMVTDNPSFFDRINFFKQNKANYALDDILSPYRRTGKLLKEVENTGNVEERLNAYHEFAVMDVELGFGIEYQKRRLIVEKNFLKTWVRPKLIKMVKAAGLLLVRQEQPSQERVITKVHEDRERQRQPGWMTGQGAPSGFGPGG